MPAMRRSLPEASCEMRSSGRCGAVAVVALWSAASCKSDRAPTEGSAAPSPPAPVIDAAAVNALVPAALKDKIAFERRELATERGGHPVAYALAAPSGWAQTSKMFAHLRPTGATGTAPRFEVGSNCDGPCTAKAWDEISDRVHFAPLARGKVLKDERAAGRRTMIAELGDADERRTQIVVAWWRDTDPRYHVCTAVLDAALAPAVPAFERACQVVAVSGE